MTEQQFEMNLAAMLAHTMLWERKREVPEGVVDDFRLEGDKSAKKTKGSVSDVMLALKDFLPDFTQQLSQAQLQGAANEYGMAQAYAPGLSALQQQMYAERAPQLAATQREIARQDAMQGAATDASVLANLGPFIVNQTQGLDKILNPEYYQTRAHQSALINQMLSGKLTAAEQEQINRSLLSSNADAGTLGVGSNISTVGNAMLFGNAASQRQQAGAQLANSFLPLSQRELGGTYNLARGTTNLNSAPGTSQFKGVNYQPTGQTLAGGTSNVLGNVFDIEKQQAGLQSQGTTMAQYAPSSISV